jgi:ABC-2 type transport system permease protein
LDHLLVIPLTPFEIAMSKIWANGLVIIVAVGLSLYLVVRGLLGIPIAGSIPLFLLGGAIYRFFATAIGIFLGTVARSMPQLGLPYLLVYLPWPCFPAAQKHAALAQASPTVHFVSFAQAILYRGAGFAAVWPQFAIVALIGGLFLGFALLRFRRISSAA